MVPFRIYYTKTAAPLQWGGEVCTVPSSSDGKMKAPPFVKAGVAAVSIENPLDKTFFVSYNHLVDEVNFYKRGVLNAEKA